MIKKVHVIANPMAGQAGNAILRVLANIFHDADIKWDLDITHETGDGTRLAEKALKEGQDALVVFGGDGTVREVVAALLGTDVPLAVLPGGTGNLFAVGMGIPRGIRRAVRLIAGPHRIRQVDVGLAGEETFLVAAATGLIADVMEEADREMKAQLGYPAYLLAGYRELWATKAAHYRLDLGDEVVEGDGVACLVSNTNSVGISGVSVPREGDNADGLLDVVLFEGIDPPTVLSVAANIIGVEDLVPPLNSWAVPRVTVEADPPQLITCDGDIVGHTPVDIRVLPRALGVIVPERVVNGGWQLGVGG